MQTIDSTPEQVEIIEYYKRLQAAEIEMVACVVENALAFEANPSNWQAAHLKGQAEGSLYSIREELKATRRAMDKLGIC
jgi:ElaB/YqjD/DUF883 family membrane-anchored ribosome-binding protein